MNNLLPSLCLGERSGLSNACFWPFCCLFFFDLWYLQTFLGHKTSIEDKQTKNHNTGNQKDVQHGPHQNTCGELSEE
jgi:hypothetical protein